jgi:hypothetical protein
VSNESHPTISVFVCPGGCRCNCASGARDCDHVWDGPAVPIGDSGESSSCSRCGVAAIDHDLMGMP